MELNHTCLELLKILYDQQEYISISTLASRLAKTERSVRYSLDLIDEFLKRKKLPFLSRKFGSGIYLEHTPETEATLHGLRELGEKMFRVYSILRAAESDDPKPQPLLLTLLHLPSRNPETHT